VRSLVIIGAGGHARETLDVVEAMNAVVPTYEVIGMLADEADEDLLVARGVHRLGVSDHLLDTCADEYILGIGMPWVRRSAYDKLDPAGCPAATLVHPAATVGGANRLSEGVILAAGARVTTNVELGRHTHLNINAVVSHDAQVGEFVTLSPGAVVNGDVVLEDDVFLGTAAVVVRGCRVGSGAIVGAGAVVVSDIPAGVTAKGVPARW